MEQAVRVSDGEVVYAKDYLHKSVNPYGFYCPYCKTELRLKSFKPHNEKAAHFAPRYRDVAHTKECVISSRKSSRTANGADDSTPNPHINKLILRSGAKLRPVKSETSDKKEQQDRDHSKDIHSQTASHLAPVVRWYLENPLEGDSELKVPGCQYAGYKSVFQRIFRDPRKEYKGTHIFFGSLLIKNPFERRGNQIIFNFYQHSAEPIKLVLDTSGWKESARDFTIRSVVEAVEKSNEAYKRGAKDVWPYVFFLGCVDTDSHRAFYCNKHAALHAEKVEGLRLVSNDSGIYTPRPLPSPQKTSDRDIEPPTGLIRVSESAQEFERGEPPQQVLNADTGRKQLGRSRKPGLGERVKLFFEALFR